jgi:PAS domain S-box-containing protein
MGLFKFFKNLGLGVKLNVMAVLVLGTLLAAIITVASRNIESLAVQTGRHRVEQEVGLVQSQFDKAEQELLAAAKLVATRPGLVEAVANRDALGTHTAVAVGAAPLDFDDVDVVDADGARLAVVIKAGEPFDVGQEDALLSLALLGIETTGVIVEEEEGGLELWLAAVVSLRDASGAIVGGLFVSREVDDEFLEEINFSRDDIHLVLIREGKIVAQHAIHLVEEHRVEGDRVPTAGVPIAFGDTLFDETAIEQALSGQVVIADDLDYSLDGVPHALAYAPLTVGGHTCAAIVILANLNKLFIFHRQLITNTATTFTFLALAAMVTVTVFSWRSIIAPLGKIRSAAERMESGDYGQRVEVTTTDEVGRLASAFNYMTAQLQQTMARMQREIEERKQAEQALRKSETLFHSLVESLPQNVFSKDLEGRFTFANQRYCMTEGKSLADILGKTDFDLHPPELAKKYREGDRRVIEAGQVFETVEEHQPIGGERFYVQVIKAPVYDAEGQVAGILGLFWDITERKRAEEQLQRYAAELEQANEELKRFTYVVSHNLRAPLVNLKGFATELRAALAVIGSAMITALPHLDENRQPAVTKVLQEDIPEALGFIDSSVTHMDSLTKALLKLSRLGRRELKLEPVDMNALVEATLQTLAHQIEERQVRVTVGPLPEVVADRTSMEEIISRLLNNAVTYLDPGRPGQIEITGERNGDETTFHVRDNGRGIEEEDMDKVFAPFRRAGKQDVPGEGMGLPYVQTLVRRHGGRIWCESEAGVGTTFTFTLSNHLMGDL